MKIGPMEIVIVLVIVILIFGIGKLPQIGKSLGEGLRSFKKATDEVGTEVKSLKDTVADKPAVKAKPESETGSEISPPPPPPRNEDE
jgi:sec-independent protein translocase protein TatA